MLVAVRFFAGQRVNLQEKYDYPNLLRRWVREAEISPTKAVAKAAPAASMFLPVGLPQASTPVGEIRIDVRRGPTTITVAWPMAAAAECASWMRELLR